MLNITVTQQVLSVPSFKVTPLSHKLSDCDWVLLFDKSISIMGEFSRRFMIKPKQRRRELEGLGEKKEGPFILQAY